METAACFCDYSDGDADIYHERTIQARKPHLCIECHEPIEPGAHYVRSTYLCDGSWGTYATCIPCTRIRDDAYSECHSWVAGTLRETILECWGFDYLGDPSEYEEAD